MKYKKYYIREKDLNRFKKKFNISEISKPTHFNSINETIKYQKYFIVGFYDKRYFTCYGNCYYCDGVNSKCGWQNKASILFNNRVDKLKRILK